MANKKKTPQKKKAAKKPAVAEITHTVGAFTTTHSELGKLARTTKWYGDEMVSSFFYLLQKYSNDQIGVHDVFWFYRFRPDTKRRSVGTQSRKRGIRANFDNPGDFEWPENVEDHDLWLIPIIDASHWVLITVDNRSNTVTLYNSLKDWNVEEILSGFKAIMEKRFPLSSFKYILCKKCPEQPNQSDCGPVVCNFGALAVLEYTTGSSRYLIDKQKPYEKYETREMRQKQTQAVLRKEFIESDVVVNKDRINPETILKKYVTLIKKDQSKPKSAEKLFSEVEQKDNDEKYLAIMSEKLSKQQKKQKRGRRKNKQLDEEKENKEAEKNADEDATKEIENEIDNNVEDELVDNLVETIEKLNSHNGEMAEKGDRIAPVDTDVDEARIDEEHDVNKMEEKDNNHAKQAQDSANTDEARIDENHDVNKIKEKDNNHAKEAQDSDNADEAKRSVATEENEDDEQIDLTDYEIRWGCPYYGCSFTVAENSKAKLKAHYDSVKGRIPNCKHRRRYDGMTNSKRWLPSKRMPIKILKSKPKSAQQDSEKK